jgi:hypothetical protein
MGFPSTACIVQKNIGAVNAAAFDLEAACSGFLYGLTIADNFVKTGFYRHILVIGAETLSKITDYTDRNTCVIFGDGAGAAVVSEVPEGYGILSSCIGADGRGGHLLSLPAGGSRIPASMESVQNKLHYIKMDGSEELLEILNEFFKLRMKLVPYLYSAFVKYSLDGTPPFRALVMDYPNDKETYNIDDQFIMGDNLMACLVTEGNSERKIYFPKGCWYNFYTNEKFDGGAWYDIKIPIDQIALYVKDNTILPLAQPVMYATKDGDIELSLLIYGENPKPCILYEDDGESLDYEKGIQNQVIISYINGEITTKREGNYKINRIKIKDVKNI